MKLETKILETDVLVVGGGTAGCYAALTLSKNQDINIIVADKANIKRSGCLAAGVNAINAYINEGYTPEDFVDYVKKEAEGIVREDLVYSIAKNLNKVTKNMESIGLTILKDLNGKYVTRGKRSIKINGENIKPLLANEINLMTNINVLNKVNIIDYIIKDNIVIGAYGFHIEENTFYVIYSKAVICTTGGASGLYKPNNPGFSKHKMWYSPFNTGAGYAMGIRAGAEMTSFEMRFIALRCKDTIAPTGTVAQGIGARQVNASGDEYVKKYGKPLTTIRLFATVEENGKGLGPCYLKTKGISGGTQEELYKAYLNMAPAQTLKWIEDGDGPSKENLEIEGTEPYIVGGHAASGYWVDTKRSTTISGLYAAGDVAGGSPKKYVTGCFVEGEIAADAATEFIKNKKNKLIDDKEISAKVKLLETFLEKNDSLFSINGIEEAMQKVMDEYAGGISKNYVFNSSKLQIASKKIEEILVLSNDLRAKDMRELLQIYEVIDRLYVCKVLIVHLLARKETRWKCYGENADFKEKDENLLKYVNTIYKEGTVQVVFRNLVKRDEVYEH
ncbi:adenylyl-sulfate reductase subunit alpha [Clostridium estertheticum]|uniref:adenylyl-sulfate reductase subunit alpha n=1 Tax=Clostridium estertheticum TaxID=238834 RepID=UPI001C0B72F2|nr:adenylyl-sulfate reductase subunit alpha [Clostridium estertheticum]MBU3216333.1 adenylyl-sulfate reductase subunit alpha [Clostridium estertheticum]WAG55434.1 adenylyl-sulfate reductase subunit alpha [Clostridium estertheticum]